MKILLHVSSLVLGLIFILNGCVLNNLLVESPYAVESTDVITEHDFDRGILTFDDAYLLTQDSLRRNSIYQNPSDPRPIIKSINWFNFNPNIVLEILETTLSYVDSSFSTADFSLFSRAYYTSDGFPFSIRGVKADITMDLISDEELLFLMHAVRGFYSNFRIELNFDDGYQLFIEPGSLDNPESLHYYTISYREQENEVVDTTHLDWWPIATGIVNTQANTIKWQGFIETEDGHFEIGYLDENPFE